MLVGSPKPIGSNTSERESLLTINWLDSCRSDVTVAGQRKVCGKVGPNAFAAGLSAQHREDLLYAEPEAGALVPNTRFKRTPCAVPPAVSWAPPSAGAEKWEKWRK